MLLRDICTLDVAFCSAQTTAVEAARLMRHRHVGDLVVVDDVENERTPLGVVTDRDLVLEVLGNGLDPATTKVASLLRHPVVLASETEDSTEALERMRAHGVRRVPVVDGQGSVVGILSVNDLLRQFVTDARGLLEIMEKGRNRERQLRR